MTDAEREPGAGRLVTEGSCTAVFVRDEPEPPAVWVRMTPRELYEWQWRCWAAGARVVKRGGDSNAN